MLEKLSKEINELRIRLFDVEVKIDACKNGGFEVAKIDLEGLIALLKYVKENDVNVEDVKIDNDGWIEIGEYTFSIIDTSNIMDR